MGLPFAASGSHFSCMEREESVRVIECAERVEANGSPSLAGLQHPQIIGFRGFLTPGWFFVLVLMAGAFARFWGLAGKPLHHDESLFAYYSYFLYKGWGYEYQPILHGPVLENVTALVFLLFGDNKFSMRLPAAVGGLCLLLVAWFWRRYLGRAGVVGALALLVLSPSILYYSRFLRNDVPYLAVTVWCAICVLRAMQTGAPRYFFWSILSATLMFSMMESSIFFFAVCIGFLLVVAATDLIHGLALPKDASREYPGDAIFPPAKAAESAEPGMPLAVVLGCLAAAAIAELVAGWFFHRMFYSTLHIYKPLVSLAERYGNRLQPRYANWMIVVMAYPVFYLFCLYIAANWRRPYGARGTMHYFLRVFWLNRWIALAAFALGVVFFTTLFTTWFTHVEGKDFWGKPVKLTPLQLYKNTWDYWWDQHKLHRIKGPFHYYLPILFTYELPSLLIVLWGWWKSLFRGKRRWLHLGIMIGGQVLFGAAYWIAVSYVLPWLHAKLDWNEIEKATHISGPGHLFLILFYVQVLTYFTGLLFATGRFVEAFLTFWAVGSLFAYSYAGEKVPWLTVHVAAPLALLAGLYIQRAWVHARWTPLRRGLAAAAVAVLTLWQVRNDLLLNYAHPASPVERLVYNHTSPDIEFAYERICDIARDTNYGKQLPVFVRGEMEWPLFWYFRDWTNTTPPQSETAETTKRPVVLVNWDASNVKNLMENYTFWRLKVREWWEPPLLNFGAMSDIWRILTPKESRHGNENATRCHAALSEWKKLWHYLAYREIWLDSSDSNYSNSGNEFAFLIRKDLAEKYQSRAALAGMPMRRDIPVYP